MLDELQFRPLLECLARHDVAFVVVGAVAAIAQGHPLTTQDLDVTPRRDPENFARLATALVELEAKLRVATGDAAPFPIEPQFLATAESWTLTTRRGDLDLVLVPAGTRGYDDLVHDAVDVDLGDGLLVAMASVRDVIRMKEAAGREKDLMALPALRRTLELIRRRQEES